MGLDASVAKLCCAAGAADNGTMSERAKSCVTGRAWAGAIVMAIPMFGLEVLVYSIVLWGMYLKLSSIAGVQFRKNFISNVLGGFIVNILIMFGLNLVLDFLMFFGWIGIGIAGYLATYLSGVAYIEFLTEFHGNNNSDNGDKSAETGTATKAILDKVNDDNYKQKTTCHSIESRSSK